MSSQPGQPHQPAGSDGIEGGSQTHELGLDLDTFLKMAVAQGTSDIHLRAGHPPVLRKDGDMIVTKLPPLTELGIQNLARRIVPEKLLPRLKNRTDFDFSFHLENMSRFRVNFFYEMGHLGLVMRLISLNIPTLDDLGH